VPVTFSIRTAVTADHAAILTVVRDAFSDETRDASEELQIVADTWSGGAVPDGFELVAVDDESGAVLGHVLGAWGDLGGRPVLGIAPLAVAPASHGTGIGTALVTELLRRAEVEALPLVVLLGDPAYYGRFGFEPSGPLGITYRPVGADNPHFQVRRLSAYDANWRGSFTYGWELPPT
jgi:putative acetyltransferase